MTLPLLLVAMVVRSGKVLDQVSVLFGRIAEHILEDFRSLLHGEVAFLAGRSIVGVAFVSRPNKFLELQFATVLESLELTASRTKGPLSLSVDFCCILDAWLARLRRGVKVTASYRVTEDFVSPSDLNEPLLGCLSKAWRVLFSLLPSCTIMYHHVPSCTIMYHQVPSSTIKYHHASCAKPEVVRSLRGSRCLLFGLWNFVRMPFQGSFAVGLLQGSSSGPQLTVPIRKSRWQHTKSQRPAGQPRGQPSIL